MKQSKRQCVIWSQWKDTTLKLELARSILKRIYNIYYPHGRNLSNEEIQELLQMFQQWNSNIKIKIKKNEILYLNHFLLWLQIIDTFIIHTIIVIEKCFNMDSVFLDHSG